MKLTFTADGTTLTSSSNYLALLIPGLVASIVLPRGRTWRSIPSSDVVPAAAVSVTNGSILFGNAFTWIANYVHPHRVTLIIKSVLMLKTEQENGVTENVV
jgi:hypothetical protein